MIRTVLSSIVGYPGLFTMCAVSGVLVPVPEDVPLLYAGVRISTGEWAWMPTLLVALPGVMLRDVLAWCVGRFLGHWLLEKGWVRTIVGASKIDRAQRIVGRHGSTAVLMGRFFVGFRAPVFMVAGAMGVPVRHFAAWDLLGLVVAVPGMIGLGYLFGEPLADALLWLLPRTRLVMGLVAVLAVGWIAWRLRAAGLEASAEQVES